MDFDKVNAMVDELNKNFSIVEEHTKALKEERLEENKKIFWEVYKYFQNCYGLLEKLRLKDHAQFIAFTNTQHAHTIAIRYGHYYSNLVFDGDGFHDVNLTNPNLRWFEKEFFGRWWFEQDVMAVIKSIDFGYVEKQFIEELNVRIADKAEKIETAYNEAKEA